MRNLIDIASYQKDIERLRAIRKLYDKTENLNGGFYLDMELTIESQIKHCNECIKNLKNT